MFVAPFFSGKIEIKKLRIIESMNRATSVIRTSCYRVLCIKFETLAHLVF